MAIYDYQGNTLQSGVSAFVSVVDYGAKGDGTTDDTTSIQSAIDELRTSGGIIFFPKGTYKITASVLFYSKQTLLFENGATLLQGGAINNLLMSYCADGTTGYNGTHDCLIYGAVFDGGDYTANNTLVGIIHAKNISIENCVFKNAYGAWHNLEINSSYNCKVINCDFEGSRKTATSACLIQIDAISNTGTWPWPDNIGAVDSTISKYIEIENTIFHDDAISPAIGNHSTAVDDFINIHDNIFDGLTSSRGAINFQGISNIDVHDNVFNGCTTGIGSSGATYYIRNNRFVDATTAIGGTASTAYPTANIVTF